MKLLFAASCLVLLLQATTATSGYTTASDNGAYGFASVDNNSADDASGSAAKPSAYSPPVPQLTMSAPAYQPRPMAGPVAPPLETEAPVAPTTEAPVIPVVTETPVATTTETPVIPVMTEAPVVTDAPTTTVVTVAAAYGGTASPKTEVDASGSGSEDSEEPSVDQTNDYSVPTTAAVVVDTVTPVVTISPSNPVVTDDNSGSYESDSVDMPAGTTPYGGAGAESTSQDSVESVDDKPTTVVTPPTMVTPSTVVTPSTTAPVSPPTSVDHDASADAPTPVDVAHVAANNNNNSNYNTPVVTPATSAPKRSHC